MYPGISTADAMTPQQVVNAVYHVTQEHPKLLSVLSLKNCPDVIVIVLERKGRNPQELLNAEEAFGIDTEMFRGLVIAPKEHPHYNKCFLFRSVDFVPAGDRVLIENGEVLLLPPATTLPPF